MNLRQQLFERRFGSVEHCLLALSKHLFMNMVMGRELVIYGELCRHAHVALTACGHRYLR
jgi:hypothetical protein